MPLRPMPVLGLVVLLLGGCDFQRPGTWHASGTNDANLRAMLAEPGHAVQGVAPRAERGQAGSIAIYRLEHGLRQPLPDSRASTVGALAAPTPPAAGPGNGR